MEQWDIYDENKQKTGRTMNRNDWHMKPDEFHLTVLGVLQRPDGKYLITRRKLDKEWAPGWWEVPGGGVRAGEDGAELLREHLQACAGLHRGGCKGASGRSDRVRTGDCGGDSCHCRTGHFPAL